MGIKHRIVATAVFVSLAIILGAAPALAACPNPNPNPNPNLRVMHDFNGDCRSEIVWRHADGTNALWYMNGVSRMSSALLLDAPHPWFIAGTGDFNGDGKADLLWRGPDGSVVVWLMNDATKTASGYVLTGVPFSWDIAGIGDFNGDGKSDILWRAADGSVAIWFMNGTALSSSAVLADVPADWFIAGVGDFDGDGKSDILWRASDSSVAIWRMSGPVATPALLTNVPVSWSVSLVGDFDGNGKADIFWRNADGTNAIWLMNGTSIAASAIVNVTPTSWELTGRGDFNGDGKTDIVWRDSTDGSVAVWLMNGMVITSSAIAAAVPDFGWAMLPAAPAASGSIPACTAVTPTDAITPSLVASRLSGVAPLAVFFDGTGTTAQQTTRPFHDLEYRWHFGDAGSGSWTNTDMPDVSRNSAKGAVAAHVFESAGTYNVCLSVFDGTNTAIERVQVTVQDPEVVFAGAKTTCFSTTADFAGCPAGANKVTTSNFVTAMGNVATGKRLLFHRGQTWTAASASRIAAPGPGLIGAFGAGANPIVQLLSNTGIIQLSSASTPTTIKDWRVMDLELDGLSNPASIGIDTDGTISQFTMLRMNIHHTHDNVLFNRSILDWHNTHGSPGHTLFDQIAIVDSNIHHAIGGVSGGYLIFAAASRFSVLGNVIIDSTAASHAVRITHANRAVISNNAIGKPATGMHALKLHAEGWTTVGVSNPGGVGTYTERMVISDNHFIGFDPAWTVAIGPQDSVSDERLRNIVVERNWFEAGAGQQVALILWAIETTIRNNIFDLSGALFHTAVVVGVRGIEPPPREVRVQNNTVYSASAADFVGVEVQSAASNVTVQNNLASAPIASSPTLLLNKGAIGVVSSNNLLNNAPGTLFVNPTPAVPADFKLKALPNPARNTGLATVPVYSDFFGVRRPQQGVMDRGAAEGP
jgi:VCBS repeat protein/PKD domain-containing protein